MATKYARAAGGAWATDATWSTTSGGAADTTAPGASDDAVIDANSGAVTSVTGSVISLTITNTTSKTTAVTFSGALTCSGAFSVTGNSATNRIICQSTTLGTARTITAATTSLTNVDFRDITAAGAAAWTGTSVGNALGNTGITFATPVTRYGVVAGNWSDTATWSATSGGSGGASVPLCHDTVIFDASSAAGTYTNDMPRIAGPTCTGFTRTLNIGTVSGNEIYGSITLGSGMTLTHSSASTVHSRTTAYITSAGKSFLQLTMSAVGGTVALADAYTSTGPLTCRIGTFDTAGFSCTATTYDCQAAASPAGATTFGTSTVTLTSTGATPFTATTNVTMSAASSTIVLSGATATDRTFAGAGKTYGTLTDQNTSTGKLTITGANTFGTINKTATVACTLALPTSSGITVTDNFNSVRGISGALLTLTGDVTKVSGIVSCDYLNISSSDAAGGATFYAGANSTDGGSNTGWVFGAPTGGRPFKGGAATVTSPAGADTVTTIEGALVVL